MLRLSIFLIVCFPFITGGQNIYLPEILNSDSNSINVFNNEGAQGLFRESCTRPLEDPRGFIGHYKNDKRVGIWIVVDYSYRRIRLSLEVPYEDGRINGVVNVYKRRRLREQHEYKNDLKEGYSRFFSKKGTLIGIALFSNDKFVKMIFDSGSKEVPKLKMGDTYYIPKCN